MGRSLVALVVVAAVAVSACGGGDDDDAAPTPQPVDPTTSTSTAEPPMAPTAADLCSGAQPVSPAPTVASPDLVETSGLAASRRIDGVLWAHNDSGGSAEVFAVGLDGADRGRYPVDGADALDWEDMALGPGPGGEDHLYLGDIGDNASHRRQVVVYRALEPDEGAGGISEVDALPLTYGDGARDAETLLADPLTGDLFVVSKQWDGTAAGIYRVPADTPADSPLVMERAGDVASTAGQLVTGGDISADGRLVALRTYGGVLLWDRQPDQTVAEALAASPCSAPQVAEAQGEAVAFLPDGQGYVTISEGAHPPVNQFRL
jgi:hypothetical protein